MIEYMIFPQLVSLISAEFHTEINSFPCLCFFRVLRNSGKFKENNDSVRKFLVQMVTYGVLYVSYMTSYICFYMYWSHHACSIKYSQLKIQWLWFDFPMLSNVRSYKINWKVRYDSLYMFIQLWPSDSLLWEAIKLFTVLRLLKVIKR